MMARPFLVPLILSVRMVIAGGISSSLSPLLPFLGAPTRQDDSQCHFERPVLSCSTSPVHDACCSPTPGGLVLQTQFWDTFTGLEQQGQLLPDATTWTIHGLWPDFCNGSFTQYCDFSRQFDPFPSPPTTNGLTIPPYSGPGVDTFIKSFGRTHLLDFMSRFWVSQGSPNEVFWAHEFSKHATCFSTYDVSCYVPYFLHMDVVDFFESVVRAYKEFPTAKFLSSHGIVPSNITTYTLAALQNAVKAHTGAIPYFGCSGPRAPESDGRTILSEVWYFNHVMGKPQDGEFVHIDTVTPSTCTVQGNIRYLERSPDSIRKCDRDEETIKAL